MAGHKAAPPTQTVKPLYLAQAAPGDSPLLSALRSQASACTTLLAEIAAVNPTLHTLHLTPYPLHPTPYTLHPTPYTLHPTPYTLHPTPYTLHPKPNTLHP